MAGSLLRKEDIEENIEEDYEDDICVVTFK